MKVIFDVDELITQLTDASPVIALIQDPIVLDYLAREYTKYYVENNNNQADFEVVDRVAQNNCTHAVTLDFLAQKIKDGTFPYWFKRYILCHENTSEITKKMLED